MTDVARIPTLQDIYDSKDAMDDIQSFTYDDVDSFVDAKSITRDTVTGRIKKMGYAVPIAYAAAINFAANDNVKTVEEAGIVYAPLTSALPFTTSGTFIGDDDARFFVVQGITEDRLVGTGIGEGAEIVGYKLNVAGSLARTVEDKLDEHICVLDFLGLLEACAGVPDGSSIYIPEGYSEILTSTIPANKNLTIYSHNRDGVSITGPDNSPIFTGSGTVTQFILRGIGWSGGAGTSQLLHVPNAANWFESMIITENNRINNFGDFAIDVEDSVYLRVIRDNRFDNNVGSMREGWASDSYLENNLFNDNEGANPVLNIVGGSNTMLLKNTFVTGAGTITAEDILINPTTDYGRGGRIYAAFNKFGGEGENPNRIKIRAYNPITTNRSTDVKFVHNQLHGADFSEGGISTAFKIDNPHVNWTIKDNEFDDMDVIVDDAFTGAAGEFGGSSLGPNKYFNSTRQTLKLFKNGGRGFTKVDEPQMGAEWGVTKPAEPIEVRNRISYSSSLTSWNKASGVTITGSQTDTFIDGDVVTATDRITLIGHPFVDSDYIQLTTTGTLPSGLSLFTKYYVKSIDANTIELYNDVALSSIVDIISAAGTGTHTITSYVDSYGGTDAVKFTRDGASASQYFFRAIDQTTGGVWNTDRLIAEFEAMAGTANQLIVGLRDVTDSKWVGTFQYISLTDKWERYTIQFNGLDNNHSHQLWAYIQTNTVITGVSGDVYFSFPQVSEYPSDYVPTPINIGVANTSVGKRFNRPVHCVEGIVTGDGTPLWNSGSGSPEGVVTAVIGSLYTRTDGGASTTLYIKESGTGNTGWIAK